MSITLALSSNELDDEDLQVLTRQLCNSILSATDIQAELPKGAAEQGARGDLVTIGMIILAFLTEGGAVALCELLQTYFARVPSLTLEIEKPDGAKFTLTAHNIRTAEVQALLSQLSNTER